MKTCFTKTLSVPSSTEPVATSRRRFMEQGITLAAAISGAGSAWAQSWPTKPITLIVPYPPGGAMDTMGRSIADQLRQSLDATVVVENRGGAGGVLGSTLGMRAAADGHTLLFSNSGALVVQAVLKQPPPYDPVANFTAIGKVADGPNFIGVNNDLPVKTIADLVALAKREPGKLNYATPGVGSFGHFIGEYLKMLTGIDMVHIPGKGSSEMSIEVMSGRIQVLIDPDVLKHHVSGKIRAIATTHDKRLSAHPDIPTVRESGGPDLSITGWFGLFGPSGLPAGVAERLEAAVRTLVSSPEAQKSFTTYSLLPAGDTRAQFASQIASDMRRYAEIKTRAGIKID